MFVDDVINDIIPFQHCNVYRPCSVQCRMVLHFNITGCILKCVNESKRNLIQSFVTEKYLPNVSRLTVELLFFADRKDISLSLLNKISLLKR